MPTKTRAVRGKAPRAARKPAHSRPAQAKSADAKPSPAKPSITKPSTTPSTVGSGAARPQAEPVADAVRAIASAHAQLSTAVAQVHALTSSLREQAQARSAPADGEALQRAASTFQRLVAEVVDDQLSQMLPPLIVLRNELSRRAAPGSKKGARNGDVEFVERGCQTLDHVLALAGVAPYEPRPGEACEPAIHLAVGEARRDDLPDGAVAQMIEPGFRSARGKVLVPAKVCINRR